jgi:hypothetical protein
MMAIVKSEPARLPQKQRNQCSAIFQIDSRRCRNATAVYYVRGVGVSQCPAGREVIGIAPGSTVSPCSCP